MSQCCLVARESSPSKRSPVSLIRLLGTIFHLYPSLASPCERLRYRWVGPAGMRRATYMSTVPFHLRGESKNLLWKTWRFAALPVKAFRTNGLNCFQKFPNGEARGLFFYSVPDTLFEPSSRCIPRILIRADISAQVPGKSSTAFCASRHPIATSSNGHRTVNGREKVHPHVERRFGTCST